MRNDLFTLVPYLGKCVNPNRFHQTVEVHWFLSVRHEMCSEIMEKVSQCSNISKLSDKKVNKLK